MLVLQEVSQLVDIIVGSSYESISMSQFLQWYCGIRQQIDGHRTNQGEWVTSHDLIINTEILTPKYSDFGVRSPQDPLSIHSYGMGPAGYRRPPPEYSSQRSKAPTLLTDSGSGNSTNQQVNSFTKVEVNPPQQDVSLKAFLELKASSSR
jgi:hypothetical protein